MTLTLPLLAIVLLLLLLVLVSLVEGCALHLREADRAGDLAGQIWAQRTLDMAESHDPLLIETLAQDLFTADQRLVRPSRRALFRKGATPNRRRGKAVPAAGTAALTRHSTTVAGSATGEGGH